MALFIKKAENRGLINTPQKPEVLIMVGPVTASDGSEIEAVGLWAKYQGEDYCLGFFNPVTGHFVLCNGNPELPGLSIDGQGALDVDYWEL